MNERKCPICGNETSSYMGNYRKDGLCRLHANLLKMGGVVQCSKCNQFHLSIEKCKCAKNKYKELPTEGFNKCITCGTETTGYAFCRKCYRNYTEDQMLDILNNENKISATTETQSEEIPEQKDIQSSETAYAVEERKPIIIDSNNKSKCIACGKQTDGLLFCGLCYHKYKDKELLVRISKCTSVEILDDEYEGRFKCKDGHVVKSKSEKLIDDYLFDNRIQHAYERALSYGATEKEVLHPDFYLPNFFGEGRHLYIEHWGYNENNIQYTKTKKFKIGKYKELGISLFCTYEKTDMNEIDTVLNRKLKYAEEGKINYEEVSTEEPEQCSRNRRDEDLPF